MDLKTGHLASRTTNTFRPRRPTQGMLLDQKEQSKLPTNETGVQKFLGLSNGFWSVTGFEEGQRSFWLRESWTRSHMPLLWHLSIKMTRLKRTHVESKMATNKSSLTRNHHRRLSQYYVGHPASLPHLNGGLDHHALRWLSNTKNKSRHCVDDEPPEIPTIMAENTRTPIAFHGSPSPPPKRTAPKNIQ